MRVLVTGAFGWTARPILEELRQHSHDIIAFDNDVCPPEVRDLATSVITADIRDPHQVDRAADGADAVVHLAVATGQESYASPELPFAVNVLGAYNLFESAHRHRLTRVVLISEAPVHLPSMATADASAGWTSSAEGDHLYDLTKRLQEEIAKDYADTHGLDVVTLRIGHVVDGRTDRDPHGRDLAKLSYCRGGWVCRYDVAAAVRAALELSLGPYRMYHVVGARQARHRFDVERTENDLRMTFTNRFEAYE